MKLYHGTNTDFLEIDLSQSNRFKDFGRGFYLTDIKRQAEEMARRRVLQNGGMPIVQVYEFDDKYNQYYFGTERAISLLKRLK